MEIQKGCQPCSKGEEEIWKVCDVHLVQLMSAGQASGSRADHGDGFIVAVRGGLEQSTEMS